MRRAYATLYNKNLDNIGEILDILDRAAISRWTMKNILNC